MKPFRLLTSLLAIGIAACNRSSPTPTDTLVLGGESYKVSYATQGPRYIFVYPVGPKDATMVFTFGVDTVGLPASGTYNVVAKASTASDVDIYTLLAGSGPIKYFSTGQGNYTVTLGSNSDGKPTLVFTDVPMKSDNGIDSIRISGNLQHIKY